MFGRTLGAGRTALRLATIVAVTLIGAAVATGAAAETRTLKFFNLHTREKASFDFKVNGRYDSGELKKINWFLRDWRKAKATTMDPRLLDLIWEAYRQSGSNGYINVICGYRSPATNEMLRSRSSGVAKQSQHTLGRALDFYIPDVPLKKMREIGLKMQVGGVGYYPRSGSPFVHFDVGNARHWPRMSRRELLAVFPNGNTVHVPSDGKPLPGYSQALASYKARRGQSEIQVANAGSSRSSGGGKSLIAMLFGGGDSAEAAEDEADVAAPTEAPARAAPVQAKPEAQVQVAAVVPQPRPARNLPAGVSVPVADGFDVGSPAAAATQVATLEAARVPVPTFAARAKATPAETNVSGEVDALVAALEAPKPETVASGQLAFAVPTPTDRPNFAALLKRGATAEAPAADDASTALSALAAVDRGAVAAVVPANRPAAGAAAESKPRLRNASFSSEPKPARKPARSVEIASDDGSIEAEILAGKGGRVVRPGAGAGRSQETISSRIAIASLTSAPRTSGGEFVGHPSGELGQALRARGFTLVDVRYGD
ncbi:DUF882 domain-containing protein [Jiella sonneratiae]|uniref:Murein endopeptidase K n=1 Tax=Jiella sonneratiae TaxID=2816856 RepID=A0ABS3JAJ1_9HYPH|nr:DUF882 domain-containing protein [Jiella sonneratiae]MBO0905591.1 DUF882 domain-containing protein [Jiella sonneratiae]